MTELADQIEALDVTQADRDAAASLCSPEQEHLRASFKRGWSDSSKEVQAFARHRLAALRPPADVAGLVERLLAPGYWKSSDGHSEAFDRAPYDAAATLTAQAQRNAELEGALQWYAEQVAGCRKLGWAGDIFRHALDHDGGSRARAALKGGSDAAE